MAAREIMPARPLIFTDARTMAELPQLIEQLLEKLSLAQEACAFKKLLYQPLMKVILLTSAERRAPAGTISPAAMRS